MFLQLPGPMATQKHQWASTQDCLNKNNGKTTTTKLAGRLDEGLDKVFVIERNKNKVCHVWIRTHCLQHTTIMGRHINLIVFLTENDSGIWRKHSYCLRLQMSLWALEEIVCCKETNVQALPLLSVFL